MKLNRTPNPLDRNTRNSDNENWDIIEGEFKKVDNTFGEVNDRVDNIIDEVSDDALKKVVDNAKLNWKEPVDNFNDLPSNAQIGDTRMDKSTGKVYRYDGANWVEIQQIDAGPVNELDSRISSQLNDTESNVKRFNSYKTVGYLRPPEDFPRKIPFNIFKNRDGTITHDFDFNQYKTDNKIYVHNAIGHDTEYDGKRDTPFRTLNKAIEVANSGSETMYNIVFLEKFISDEVYIGEVDLEKDIVFSSDLDGGSFFATTQRLPGGYSWEKIDGVYRTSRKRVATVVDYKFKDVFGKPREYLTAESLSDLKSNKGTYFQDGDYIYVNRLDKSKPNDDIALLLPYLSNFKINLNGNTLFIDNVNFWRYTRNDAGFMHALHVIGNGNDSLILNNTSIRYARFMGLATEGVGECFSFDSQSMYNGYDGFNYHGNGSELVVEINCYAPFNGDVHGGTGNGTSAHDGMTIFRAGVVAHDCYGPVLADVNGCYSVNYDCVMYNSLRSPKETKAAFYFDDSGASNPGKTYLIDCEGGGEDTFSINSDGAEINVRNFKGANIPKGLLLNILE